MKKFLGGYLPHIKRIDDSFPEIEEIGEYFFRISEFSLLRKPGELLCNLVVVEWKDDIAEIEEDDLDGRRFHFFPLTPLGEGFVVSSAEREG